MNPDHYTYRVRWSAEDGEYVATAAELPSLSWLAEGPVEALIGIRALVVDVLTDIAQTGETPPAPIADRVYSGKFMMRVPPELHRSLVLAATEQNVSLNRLVANRLAGS